MSNRKDMLSMALKTLNERERHILIERRLKDEPTTLEDLSQQYNISRERVRQIEVRAFEKLLESMKQQIESRERDIADAPFGKLATRWPGFNQHASGTPDWPNGSLLSGSSSATLASTLLGASSAVGMDSAKLSAREKQPGHDRTFRRSEVSFIDVAQRSLGRDYDVIPNPKELRQIFGKSGKSALGISPEASITSKVTGRKFFVEVKKQGPAGNAEERACKHHTVRFYKILHEIYKYDYHPYVTIFCESLAELDRYTRKAEYLFEPGQYFLWKDYNEIALADFLRGRCRAWLDER
jgi:hypothetical protein